MIVVQKSQIGRYASHGWKLVSGWYGDTVLMERSEDFHKRDKFSVKV